MMRKKLWRSNPLQQPFVVFGLGDHDGGKDGIRDGEQRDGKAPVRGTAAVSAASSGVAERRG